MHVYQAFYIRSIVVFALLLYRIRNNLLSNTKTNNDTYRTVKFLCLKFHDKGKSKKVKFLMYTI